MNARIKSIFTIINSWFTFLLGLVFIFGIGVIYAYIQPEDLWLNLIFLGIALGWVAFTIKYIWDVMDKKKNASNISETVPPSQITADFQSNLEQRTENIEQKETTQ